MLCNYSTCFLPSDALLECPIDTRRELAANIVIVGGTSLIYGFKARLFEELSHLLKREPYLNRLHIDELKCHSVTKANISCWAGASIFGGTDAIATRSFTRENFFKDRKSIPDWSNLKYNSVFNSERHG